MILPVTLECFIGKEKVFDLGFLLVLLKQKTRSLEFTASSPVLLPELQVLEVGETDTLASSLSLLAAQ